MSNRFSHYGHSLEYGIYIGTLITYAFCYYCQVEDPLIWNKWTLAIFLLKLIAISFFKRYWIRWDISFFLLGWLIYAHSCLWSDLNSSWLSTFNLASYCMLRKDNGAGSGWVAPIPIPPRLFKIILIPILLKKLNGAGRVW